MTYRNKQQSRWMKRDRRLHPEKYRLRSKLRQPYIRARKYGLRLQDVNDMEMAQNNVCAICGRPPSNRGFCIDHDHLTGKVRKLLCISCNRMLGYAGDDPLRLERAAAYLRAHNVLEQLLLPLDQA
jgi:hypothetical protein